jgi:hypothetical protein
MNADKGTTYDFQECRGRGSARMNADKESTTKETAKRLGTQISQMNSDKGTTYDFQECRGRGSARMNADKESTTKETAKRLGTQISQMNADTIENI